VICLLYRELVTLGGLAEDGDSPLEGLWDVSVASIVPMTKLLVTAGGAEMIIAPEIKREWNRRNLGRTS
jgi:hypothetical protein